MALGLEPPRDDGAQCCYHCIVCLQSRMDIYTKVVQEYPFSGENLDAKVEVFPYSLRTDTEAP
jgi:hypothetical protein